MAFLGECSGHRRSYSVEVCFAIVLELAHDAGSIGLRHDTRPSLPDFGAIETRRTWYPSMCATTAWPASWQATASRRVAAIVFFVRTLISVGSPVVFARTGHRDSF
jgi:hypothetical protein